MRIIDIPYLNVTGPDCEYEVAQCSARVVSLDSKCCREQQQRATMFLGLRPSFDSIIHVMRFLVAKDKQIWK